MQELSLEKVLSSRISNNCSCNFNSSDFHDSSVVCDDSGRAVYSTRLAYSSFDGSETALTIAGRLEGQMSFSIMVGGSEFTVTSIVCLDCSSKLPVGTIVGAVVGGTAAVIVAILAIVIIA